jgi:hypothetical protein
VRSVQVATGDLDPARLYDLRSFKTCWAELAYLHRLAAGGRHGGTVVTSMRQLVTGVAPLHPAWKLSGDRWEDRDRHHKSVRRRLSSLAAAQLLRWRIGLDEDLEERRTELVLLPVPELLPDELAAAAAKLRRWEARYGLQLNTASPIGIRDVKRAAAPLSAEERQRRGCRRVRRTVSARRRVDGSKTISTPPFGAPPTSEDNDQAFSSNRTPLWSVYQHRTRGRARQLAPSANDPAAPPQPAKAATSKGRPKASGPPANWQAELLERVAARADLIQLRERQASGRAVEVAQWGLERHWPISRLKEAWVVARHGSAEAVLHGGRAAGPLVREQPATGEWQQRSPRDDYLTLRRAVARYERNHAAAPDGFPANGLAALLHLGVIAREADDRDRPMYLAYAIGALNQLSRRMRALATADSTQRTNRQIAGAKARHTTPPDAGPLSFRTAPWPSWVVLGADGLPQLKLNDRFEDALVTRGPGAPSSQVERETLRDAILLRHGALPHELDGRRAMALRATGEIPRAERRPRTDPARAELAHLTGIGQRQLGAFTDEQIAGMLERARTRARRDDERAREHRRQNHDRGGLE